MQELPNAHFLISSVESLAPSRQADTLHRPCDHIRVSLEMLSHLSCEFWILFFFAPSFLSCLFRLIFENICFAKQRWHAYLSRGGLCRGEGPAESRGKDPHRVLFWVLSRSEDTLESVSRRGADLVQSARCQLPAGIHLRKEKCKTRGGVHLVVVKVMP